MAFIILLFTITIFQSVSYAVISGDNVEKRHFPEDLSTVALQMKYTNSDGTIVYRKGSAFIISKDSFLTAGHNTFYIENSSDIEIIFSTQPCWGENLCNEKRIRASSKIVHPNFANPYPNPPIFDISILKIEEELPYGFKPLILDSPKLLNSNFYFLGYGKSIPNPNLDNFRLRKVSWSYENFNIKNEQKFIFPQNFGGFCAGDSGGALIQEENGKFYALGIAIHHEENSSQTGCLKSGVYTSIKYFLNWINVNIN